MCRDYILVGSDSGRIVILEYIKDGNHFKKIHQETFGKSGCRRIVPGQYMAADPKGRACMIGEEFPLWGASCLFGPCHKHTVQVSAYCVLQTIAGTYVVMMCITSTLWTHHRSCAAALYENLWCRDACAGAVEKQKMVYVLNRDQAANLTISSPLDAHKSHHLVFSVTGLDVGFDNPVFAAIELDYADADQVKLSPEMPIISGNLL